MNGLKKVFVLLDSPVDGKIETMSVYFSYHGDGYETSPVKDADNLILIQAMGLVQAVGGQNVVEVSWTESGDEWDYDHTLTRAGTDSVEHTCNWEQEWNTQCQYSGIVLIPGMLPLTDPDIDQQVTIFCELAGIAY